ncbi:MAG TPA: MlaD family protein [Haliangiales bacterium]|nr:MlaD family protein [Haliangiales bacterium]
MKERSLELKVGLLVLVAAGVLGAFIFFLGSFSLAKGYRLFVDFNFAGNVQKGAPVKVSGIKVGKIDEIQFLGGALDEKTGRRVQVRVGLWVEERAKDAIRENAEFFVSTAGVLGEQYIEIVPGTHDKPALAPDSIVVGVDPARTDLIIARLYELLDSATSIVRDDKDVIRNMLKNAAGAAASANEILSDNREELKHLIASAAKLSDQGTAAIAEFRAGMGDPKLLGKTVADVDGLVVSARRTLDEATPRAVRFLDEATRVAGLITENRVDRLVNAADAAASFLARTNGLVENAAAVVEGIRAGKGTVGALLVKEEVYADIKEMVRDLKRNPWKFLWKE